MASASLSPSISPSLSPSTSPSPSPSASPSEEFLGLEVMLPLLQMSFDGHVWLAEVSITLPMIQTSITGLSGVGGSKVKMEMPLVGVSFSGKTSITGNVSVNIPLFDANVNGYSGVIGSFALTLPLLTSSWIEHPDRVGTFAITLPLIIPFVSGNPIPFTMKRYGVVMNFENRAVTEYKDFNFNSLVMWNGVIVGTNEEGLFIIGGDDDMGQEIESYIQTGTYDLGEGAIRIPKEAWLTYRSDGNLDVEVREDEANVYNHPADKVAVGIRECRTKLGKGYRGRFYRFGIKNIGGSDFDLHSFRVMAEILRRKTR